MSSDLRDQAEDMGSASTAGRKDILLIRVETAGEILHATQGTSRAAEDMQDRHVSVSGKNSSNI